MGRVLLLLVGVATLLFPRAASADAVSWQFYGSVVSVYPGKESILPLGSPVQIGFS